MAPLPPSHRKCRRAPCLESRGRLGAGLVTLAGRMLSLGLADLRGHVDISFDDGAWLDSAYNASLMFIGPFTVYLGGLLGPRRVLLSAAAIFALTCAFLPFVHSYALLLAALVLAGMTSGTFYPLTLTFALRNIPLRYLPFTIALYATFVDGAVNIAPSLYGWYRDHLSWQWMFWNSAAIAPFMILCVYLGIPPTPPRKKTGPAPSFAGFLYLSLGLAFVFAALQQGQRLDWFSSGVFNAWFSCGMFFLLCALARRLRGPNPSWHCRIWGSGTLCYWAPCFFGFASRYARPSFLFRSRSRCGLEADQIGPAIIWSALPLLPVAFTAGYLLLRKVDPRLL